MTASASTATPSHAVCLCTDDRLENVLIDHKGFAQICDLGFAKKLRDGAEGESVRAYTRCGTDEYM